MLIGVACTGGTLPSAAVVMIVVYAVVVVIIVGVVLAEKLDVLISAGGCQGADLELEMLCAVFASAWSSLL